MKLHTLFERVPVYSTSANFILAKNNKRFTEGCIYTGTDVHCLHTAEL